MVWPTLGSRTAKEQNNLQDDRLENHNGLVGELYCAV